MVICQLTGGLGNHFYQYACARCLAHKLNTELKLELITGNSHDAKPKHSHDYCYYHFDMFNTVQEFATPEEIKRVKENGITPPPIPDLKDFQGDIYIKEYWQHSEIYFIDIIDIIRKEFTLNRSFNPIAESWRQKILAAECSVSMHFRHGDYVYMPNLISGDMKKRPWYHIAPFDYYYTCIEILKQRYKNLTVFVFSNNMQWVKENLRLDVPTEFVEGCETDDEEWLLISLCKHNIGTSSTFSDSAASLNANPDKKVFASGISTAEEVKKFHDSLTPAKKDALLNTNGWIRVPLDYYNQPKVTIQPFFSLLLVVNNDVATIIANLDSVLKQGYKYYEVIIIDNASTDGSNKICKDAIAGKENVIFKKLYSKVNNAKSWNMALDMAQGKYISFIACNDLIRQDALAGWYFRNYNNMADVLISFEWLEEDGNGNVNFAGKKYSVRRDSGFKDEKRGSIMNNTGGRDAAKLLANKQLNDFMSTKIYNREFLLDNGIRFDESLDDDKAELFFQMEAFFKSKYFVYTAHACCVAPTKKGK